MALIKLLGSAPNQVSTNKNFGTMAWQDASGVKLTGDAVINTLTVGLGSGSVATNTATGYQALLANTTGSNNTSYGYQSLNKNTLGTSNTGYGHQSGFNNLTGNYSTFIGAFAGYTYSGSGATANTFVGYRAGYSTTGYGNIFIGASFSGTGAGEGVTSGSQNTIIGAYSGSAAPISATSSNFVVLSDGGGNVSQYWSNAGKSTVFTGVIQTTGYTVATLPTGVVGMRAYVTNALAPTYGSTVVAGGAITIPVFYNGTNWIVA